MTIQFGIPAASAGVDESADLNQTAARQYGAPGLGDINDTTAGSGGVYVPSFTPPIRGWLSRQALVNPSRLAPRKQNFGLAPSGPPTGAVVDIVASFDVFTGIFNTTEEVSDSGVSSDTFVALVAFTATLSDTSVSTEHYTVNRAYSKTLSDTVVGSDKVAAESVSTVQVNFDGLVRKSLVLFVPGANSFGPIPIFPFLPENFPVKLSPVLDTTIGTTKSLREMRVAQQTYPIWDIEISFDELLDQTQNQTPYGPFVGYEQFEELVANWLSMYGQTNVFAFDCPWDDSRSEQYIGTGDGQTFAFRVFSTYGLGAQATLVPVGYINQIEAVYVNRSLVPSSAYQFSRNTLYFMTANGVVSPPGADLDITMTFSYYYLCRFVEDEQDYEEFAKNRWAVPSLKFRASPWL